ncbi:hypothetical protein SCHPADRAFT_945806 [Schizopora paradoxa]|uniref:Aminoglycoside phosphotransferase domain-containing protein n=1 Tax=Schizopora paradoxa TaxID=27342 RepID=A0A0H2R4Q8_9AGAM|nr:hypothetical protein SCHPADRAFT_945806 [Schizopora paradoxa]
MSSLSLDLSKPSDVATFLADTPFACSKADVLTGGNANFVFRLHLLQPYDGCPTAVLKHSKPWSATGQLSLAIQRQETEAEVLRRVRKMIPEDALVTVPKVYLYDNQAHIIVMQDCGPTSRTLKQFLIDEPAGLHPDEAKRLGAVLAVFVSTVQDEGTKDRELMELVAKNGDMRGIIAQYYYGRLIESLVGTEDKPLPYDQSFELSPEDVTTLKEIVKDATDVVMNNSSSFTVGDSWTGNAIVDTEPDLGEGREGYVRLKHVFIVDWEVSKPGLACLDIGQFSAELHTVRSFYPGKSGYSSVDDILPAYLGTYAARKGPLSLQDVQRMSVQIGTHMAVVTPQVSTWKSKERVREFVEESIQYLLKGKKGDVNWMKSGESILKDVWRVESSPS